MRWAHGTRYLGKPSIPGWRFYYPVTATPARAKSLSLLIYGHVNNMK